jgi:hypothetical protein
MTVSKKTTTDRAVERRLRVGQQGDRSGGVPAAIPLIQAGNLSYGCTA